MGATPSLDEALLAGLMYGLMPLWAAAGVGDWLCHRWQRMEWTAGLGESLLHLLMLLILAPATLAALLLEINASVLAWLLLACALHELVFWWDLGYASRRRTIPPAVIDRARPCLVDADACSMFGKHLPWSKILLAQTVLDAKTGFLPVAPSQGNTAVREAALAWGAQAHAFELHRPDAERPHVA